MKIISWNVNGLRAVCKRNFLDWMKKTNANIVCLQEIKADGDQIPEELLKIKGYYTYINPATSRKGYSGVLVFSKEKPSKVNGKIGYKRFDAEGRFLELHFKDFVLINLYLPHGGRAKEKLGYKLEAYANLFLHLKKLKTKKIILVGDFNIAHERIDLARPKQNCDNIMFTPKKILITKNIFSKIESSNVLTEVKDSDHCPIEIEIK